MAPPLCVLLPGLDGTARLFDPFVASAPVDFELQRLPLPDDQPRGYGELADWVRARLPTSPVALIAESFSGPLALLVADRCPNVTAVVLCATFIEPPLPSVLARAPKFVWRTPPPISLLSALLTGGDHELAHALRGAISSVNSEVIAERIVAALTVDARAELARYVRPLLCLRAKRDRLVRAASTARIAELKSSAQFAEVDSPHLLLQTKPREAWEWVKPFLEAI